MFYKVNKWISIIYSLILVGLLVLLDQWTKHLAVSHLMNKSDIILIPNVLQLHYLENTGAAFSMLEGKQTFFAVATPILLILLLILLFRMPRVKKYLYLDYIIVLVIAGAIGNHIDRVLNNYVVDFIYFSLINFNCYLVYIIIVNFISINLKFTIRFYFIYYHF